VSFAATSAARPPAEAWVSQVADRRVDPAQQRLLEVTKAALQPGRPRGELRELRPQLRQRRGHAVEHGAELVDPLPQVGVAVREPAGFGPTGRDVAGQPPDVRVDARADRGEIGAQRREIGPQRADLLTQPRQCSREDRCLL
jgi:hypothetical protein